jgi:hypothetical protein
LDRLIQIAGAALVILALLDVFLTILCARSGIAIISERLGRSVWALCRAFVHAVPRTRRIVLSYAGPSILILIVGVWIAILLTGFGLIVWPALGTSIRSDRRDTPTDFLTAVCYVGDSFTTVGTGDLIADTPFLRAMPVIVSLVGLTMITLTLAYFVEIYTSLLHQNKFALKLQHGTAGTGDAAELVARLGAAGDFTSGREGLSQMADNLLEMFEAHHFYSSMIFFRFREPHYGLPRVMLLVMESATLVRAGLDRDKYASLIDSLTVTELWEVGIALLKELHRVFIKGGDVPHEPPDVKIVQEWRERYVAAAARLRAAGIATEPDEAAAVEAYVALRQQWDAYVTKLAAYLVYERSEMRDSPTATDALAQLADGKHDANDEALLAR